MLLLFTCLRPLPVFFFFNDTATTEIYTLSLHDALPISCSGLLHVLQSFHGSGLVPVHVSLLRSEEHTSELQSRLHLVCRLLLEKKKELPARPATCPIVAHCPPDGS